MLPHLLGALRCPYHTENGRLEGAPSFLQCVVCGTRYPVIDGIPDMVGNSSPDHLPDETKQWDLHAPDYDTSRSVDPIYMANVWSSLAQLKPMKADHILEAGCGTGLALRRFHQTGMRIVGLDLSLESLRRLRSQLPNGHSVALVRADLSSLPFAPGTFDKVLCGNTLQQLPNADLRRQGMHELARVARVGATVVVSVQNYSIGKRKAGWRKEGPAGSQSGAVQYVYRFDAGEFGDLLKEAFNVQSLLGAGLPLPYRFKLAPLMRLVESVIGRTRLGTRWGNMLVGVGKAPGRIPIEISVT